jgi:hypothetical protein
MIRSPRQRWRRNLRPPGENLGRCRNKMTSIIVTRRNKNTIPYKWILGRDSDGSIQRVICRGK